MKNLIMTGILLLVSGIIYSQEIYQTKDGAIKGYDPVAYYTESKPVKGSSQFTYEWRGAKWHFSTAKNLELFKNNPDKYAPEYGGYCAYGVASGYKVKIEPEAWSIVNDKLYLNYDLGVQKSWNEDKSGYIKKADANWKNLKDAKAK